MLVIEDASLDFLLSEVQMTLYGIVKHCRAYQLKKRKPRRFLFSVKGLIIVEFNHHLEIDIFSLCQRNVLHVFGIRTGFQRRGFVEKMNGNSI